jgi:hypothetical protein
VVRFADELIVRVVRAGATREKLLRADSAFWNRKLIARLEAMVLFDQRAPAILGSESINQIPESAWAALGGLLARGRGADRRDDRSRTAADRPWHPAEERKPSCGRTGITSRSSLAAPGPLEVVEAEHRQHAVVELTIRDLKDQAPGALPPGRIAAAIHSLP